MDLDLCDRMSGCGSCLVLQVMLGRDDITIDHCCRRQCQLWLHKHVKDSVAEGCTAGNELCEITVVK